MKDGVVLFLLCVIAIGAIAAFALYMDRVPRGILPQGFEANQTAAEPSPTAAPKPPVKRSVPESAPPAEPNPTASASGSPAEVPAESSPAPVPVEAAPARPFPSVAEIAVGAEGDTIMDAYGDPALSTTTSDHGHVLETFVYARDGIRDVTVISLEDGRVSAAYSKPKSMSAVAAPPPLRRRGS
jgi:hypothetical protein